MRHLSSFVRVLAVSFTFLVAPAVFADAASVKEADALIKDDIANAQVLIEMCPNLIGKNAKFDQNIKKMVDSYLVVTQTSLLRLKACKKMLNSTLY